MQLYDQESGGGWPSRNRISGAIYDRNLPDRIQDCPVTGYAVNIGNIESGVYLGVAGTYFQFTRNFTRNLFIQ